MIVTLRYGVNARAHFELRSQAMVAHCDAPRGQALADVGQATDRALAGPCEFPTLAKTALPGDKVVLALDHGVPRASTIVRCLVDTLLASGVDAEDITVVTTQADFDAGRPDPLGSLPSQLRARIGHEIHDPALRESLSYLAASAEAKPIYINRMIHDADLVISIGCVRLPESLGYHGISSGIFPTFSDTANVERFRNPKAVRPADRDRLRREADEVRWLLGLRLTVQVVPGAGDDILHVLAGDYDAVYRNGAELCAEAWSYDVPRRASLVVATIEGDAAAQTWENFGRALSAASSVLDEDGSIVLCSELNQPLGPSLQRIVGADDLHEALREISKVRPLDALPATELIHALQRGKVYLASGIDPELVEDLGIAPVDASQLSRLAGQYDSCIVLGNAHHARARAVGQSQETFLGAKSKSSS